MPEWCEEVDRVGVAAVLAADAELQAGLRLAPEPRAHPDHLSDAGRVERLERRAVEDLDVDVAREHAALDVVAAEAERRLGEVVGAEREEVGDACDPVGLQARARQLDHRADLVDRPAPMLARRRARSARASARARARRRPAAPSPRCRVPATRARRRRTARAPASHTAPGTGSRAARRACRASGWPPAAARRGAARASPRAGCGARAGTRAAAGRAGAPSPGARPRLRRICSKSASCSGRSCSIAAARAWSSSAMITAAISGWRSPRNMCSVRHRPIPSAPSSIALRASLGRVGVGAHAERAQLVAPARAPSGARAETSGSTSGTSSVVIRPVAAVDRDRIAGVAARARRSAPRRPARSIVTVGGAGDRRAAHAARDERGVARLAALAREDAARGVEAGDVVGLGERAHEDHVASLARRPARPRRRSARSRPWPRRARPRRRVATTSKSAARVERRVQQRVERRRGRSSRSPPRGRAAPPRPRRRRSAQRPARGAWRCASAACRGAPPRR